MLKELQNIMTIPVRTNELRESLKTVPYERTNVLRELLNMMPYERTNVLRESLNTMPYERTKGIVEYDAVRTY